MFDVLLSKLTSTDGHIMTAAQVKHTPLTIHNKYEEKWAH